MLSCSPRLRDRVTARTRRLPLLYPTHTPHALRYAARQPSPRRLCRAEAPAGAHPTVTQNTATGHTARNSATFSFAACGACKMDGRHRIRDGGGLSIDAVRSLLEQTSEPSASCDVPPSRLLLLHCFEATHTTPGEPPCVLEQIAPPEITLTKELRIAATVDLFRKLTGDWSAAGEALRYEAATIARRKTMSRRMPSVGLRRWLAESPTACKPPSPPFGSFDASFAVDKNQEALAWCGKRQYLPLRDYDATKEAAEERMKASSCVTSCIRGQQRQAAPSAAAALHASTSMQTPSRSRAMASHQYSSPSSAWPQPQSNHLEYDMKTIEFPRRGTLLHERSTTSTRGAAEHKVTPRHRDAATTTTLLSGSEARWNDARDQQQPWFSQLISAARCFQDAIRRCSTSPSSRRYKARRPEDDWEATAGGTPHGSWYKGALLGEDWDDVMASPTYHSRISAHRCTPEYRGMHVDMAAMHSRLQSDRRRENARRRAEMESRMRLDSAASRAVALSETLALVHMELNGVLGVTV